MNLGLLCILCLCHFGGGLGGGGVFGGEVLGGVPVLDGGLPGGGVVGGRVVGGGVVGGRAPCGGVVGGRVPCGGVVGGRVSSGVGGGDGQGHIPCGVDPTQQLCSPPASASLGSIDIMKLSRAIWQPLFKLTTFPLGQDEYCHCSVSALTLGKVTLVRLLLVSLIVTDATRVPEVPPV